MDVVCLHDKAQIAAILRREPPLHVYALGDLDDFFWPYTLWYARRDAGELTDVVLLYTGLPIPTLLALAPEPADGLRELLGACLPLLPRHFYAHLTPGLTPILASDYTLHPHGMFAKMTLTKPNHLKAVDTSEVAHLSPADLDETLAFYAASYPDNWFDPRMLETGYYFGYRHEDRLVSVAGVHVYSPKYQVAALGNIATHPDARGRGYATRVTARLCQALLPSAPQIGLNVRVGNAFAIACYKRLGFAQIGIYEEYTVAAVR
jgi:ribosomal protein S18 acetylase RimI-like enzyme